MLNSLNIVSVIINGKVKEIQRTVIPHRWNKFDLDLEGGKYKIKVHVTARSQWNGFVTRTLGHKRMLFCCYSEDVTPTNILQNLTFN